MGKYERFIIYPIMAALCFAVFGGHIPFGGVQADDDAAKVTKFGVVECRELRVVDGRGREKVTLRVAKEHGQFRLLNSAGKVGIHAAHLVDGTGSALVMYDQSGEMGSALSCSTNDGGRLVTGGAYADTLVALDVRVEDTKGRIGVSLGSAENGHGLLTVWNRKSKPGLTVTEVIGGTRLRLWNVKDENRLGASLSATGRGGGLMLWNLKTMKSKYISAP